MNFEETKEEVQNSMKKAAFWKCAAFGIVCINQEFEVYRELAKDRFFDMSKFLQKTVERFWKAAATGYAMDEQYILAVEESFFEPRDGWEEMALQIVQDIYDLFYAIAEKNAKKALKMQECQIRLIEKYVSLTELTSKKKQELFDKAVAHHVTLAGEIAATSNKEKKPFLEKLSSRELYSLLGDELSEHHPVIKKKEKPAKKKLPEIRSTSLDFDNDAKEKDNEWLLNSTPEQWVLGPEMNIAKAAAYGKHYANKDYFDLCYNMDVCYRIYAEDDYVMNRIPQRTRGFWYLSAFSFLRAYQLWEKGYPAKFLYYVERHQNGDVGFQPIFSKMICAYASGEDALLPQLCHFSREKEQKETYALLSLLTGGDGEELYSAIEAWEDSEIKQGLLAVLQRDEKEIRKAVLRMIRHDRKMYEMNRTMVDPCAYTCLRLAKERGIDMEPVMAAEVLDGNLDMTPLDKSYWKLPYQDEIDEWLKSHS